MIVASRTCAAFLRHASCAFGEFHAAETLSAEPAKRSSISECQEEQMIDKGSRGQGSIPTGGSVGVQDCHRSSAISRTRLRTEPAGSDPG
jgi:hypothetical protein